MSEFERRKRQDYKRRRKNSIFFQASVIALVLLVTVASFLTYNRLNRVYYVEYTEQGSIDYAVQYKENNFFDEEWIGSGQSYVSELISSIRADFSYQMNMMAADVGFEYDWSVAAQLIVSDKLSGDPIYDPTEILVDKVSNRSSGTDRVTINQGVDIDYAKYNAEAKSFIDTYDLKYATSMLTVTLTVHVLSTSEQFVESNANTYTTSLLIPLCEDNFSITTGANVATAEKRVLATGGASHQNIYLGVSVGGALLSLLLGTILAIYVFATRNEDVNYTIKVKKLLRSYRSFIQQIDGEFDTSGYQVVSIKTFVELLGLRDTIQSPILMSENVDQTKTQFLIPTDTKILYVYEIKVDNYDELYANIARKEEKITPKSVVKEVMNSEIGTVAAETLRAVKSAAETAASAAKSVERAAKMAPKKTVVAPAASAKPSTTVIPVPHPVPVYVPVPQPVSQPVAQPARQAPKVTKKKDDSTALNVTYKAFASVPDSVVHNTPKGTGAYAPIHVEGYVEIPDSVLDPKTKK